MDFQKSGKTKSCLVPRPAVCRGVKLLANQTGQALASTRGSRGCDPGPAAYLPPRGELMGLPPSRGPRGNAAWISKDTRWRWRWSAA